MSDIKTKEKVKGVRALDIFCFIKVFRSRNGVLFHYLWLFIDSVHTETSDILMLIRISNYIVIVAVPNKRTWTEDVHFTVMTELLFLFYIVLEILEGYLLALINGIIQSIYDIVDLLINRFKSALNT